MRYNGINICGAGVTRIVSLNGVGDQRTAPLCVERKRDEELEGKLTAWGERLQLQLTSWYGRWRNAPSSTSRTAILKCARYFERIKP
jgi:hypothetical protein